MVISHNIYAMNAQRQFKINTKSKAKNNEKLSSGYKINRSADDAAGLSISEKMRNQIRGLNQGLENAENGMGYIQTAEGALNEVHSILARMEELAVQSANDVNTAQDRKSIDDEIQQLKEEMGIIFDRTAFNGKKIWNHDVYKDISSDLSNKIYEINDGLQEPTELKRITAITINQGYNYEHITLENADGIPTNEGITINADSNGLKFTWTGYDGNTYESKLCPWKESFSGEYNINIKDYLDLNTYPQLSGVNYTYSFDIDWRISKEEAINIINGQKINAASWTNVDFALVDENGNRTSRSADEKISIVSKTFFPGGGCAFDAFYGVTDYSYDDEIVKFLGFNKNPIESGNNNENWEFSLYTTKLGTLTTYPKGGIARFGNTTYTELYDDNVTSANTTFSSSVETLKKLYDYVCENSSTGGEIEIVLGFDEPAKILKQKTLGVIFDNDATFEDILSKLSEVKGIKPITGSHRVEYRTSSLYFGADVDASLPDEKPSNGLNNSDKQQNIMKEFYIQHGANAGEDMLISYDCLSNDYLGLTNTNVLTREESSQAINDIQEAVKKVSAQRSQFGAYQNRLEYIAANNANYSENLQNAESNLRDTDMAKEMVSYSKNSILEQAAQAMISQANQQNQGMLQLLQ